MLVEADHVLKLVNQDRREKMKNIGFTDGTCASGRVRHQAVKDLTVVGVRIGDQVETEKVSQDERAVGTGPAQVVDGIGQQYNDDAVVVAIRLAAEGGSIDFVHVGRGTVEERAQGIDVLRSQASRGDGVVQEDCSLGAHEHRGGGHIDEAGAVDVGAHLERLLRAEGRGRRRGPGNGRCGQSARLPGQRGFTSAEVGVEVCGEIRLGRGIRESSGDRRTGGA